MQQSFTLALAVFNQQEERIRRAELNDDLAFFNQLGDAIIKYADNMSL